MSDDVHGVEILKSFERQSDLPRCRHGGVENSRLYSRPEAVKNCLDIVDRWIDEKDFRDVRHVALPHTLSRIDVD